MKLNPDAVGTASDPHRRSWTSTDCLLYAVSIGAGLEALPFVTENSGAGQEVYPTFVDTRAAALDEIWDAIGATDRSTLVHGSQRTEVAGALPPDGEVDVRAVLTGLHDRGQHAVVEIEQQATDVATGERAYTCTQSLVLRGRGGFGGDRGPDPAAPLAAVAAPDDEIVVRTATNQALLYRLNGDRNPLHSNPALAEKVGFERPILHGLCTYGIAARVALHRCADGDPGRFRAFSGRFTKPVLPGDELRVQMWHLGAGRSGVRVLAGEDRRVALDDALLEHAG